MLSPEDLKVAEELTEAIHSFSQKGWVPATSSNFSFRTSQGGIAVSESGIDKSKFSPENFILIDDHGEVSEGEMRRTSAETKIHTTLYQFLSPGCVMHTHSPAATVLSMENFEGEKMVFEGYEVLKGLEGNSTHETSEILPIYANCQDMGIFCDWLADGLETYTPHHGFLIAGHGLYTWGANVFQAKRHIEVFEFLFTCELMKRHIPHV